MVTTEKRNGENRLSKFKKALADLADFGRFFRQNPECFKKQTDHPEILRGKNRILVAVKK